MRAVRRTKSYPPESGSILGKDTYSGGATSLYRQPLTLEAGGADGSVKFGFVMFSVMFRVVGKLSGATLTYLQLAGAVWGYVELSGAS